MVSKIKVAFVFLASVGLLISPNVGAQEMTLKSSNDTPVDRIQEKCDIIRPILRRLHTNDALLRVNVGQEYNNISAKLMARLNSRLAINRIDSQRFVEIAAKFDSERTVFSSSYSEYEAQLSSLIKIDCKTDPTYFYAVLISARDARHKLSVSVQSMNDSLSEYRIAVEDLQQELFNGNKDGNAS